MKTLKDAARWTLCQLRVLYCVVQVLVGTLIKWLLCQFPSMKDRLIAEERRVMKSYTGGNWEVRCTLQNESIHRLTRAHQEMR